MRVAAQHLRARDVIAGLGQVIAVEPRSRFEDTHTFVEFYDAPDDQAALRAISAEFPEVNSDHPAVIDVGLDRNWLAVPNGYLFEVTR